MTIAKVVQRIVDAVVPPVAIGVLFFGVYWDGRCDPGLPAEKEANEMQDLQEKRNNYEKKLQEMPIKTLALQMAADSAKGVEPFNSAAYRIVISREKSIGGQLKSFLTKDDRSSLLALLALRKVDFDSYSALDPQFRVNVLIDAFKNSKYFNIWGIPDHYWEDAAKALIAEKEKAIGPLSKLLDDDQPAPVFGSEAATIYQHYHYLVKDYAAALLKEISH